MVTLESATAKRLLITSGTRCLHKKLWSPILLIGFPDTSFLTFLEMPFAVWLVSDFVSTPFALKQQFVFPPLPLLATCVRLMMMSRMKHMFSLLHAPSDGFSPQEVHALIFTDRISGCVCFLHQENNHLFIHELILLYEQASSHTS